MQVSPREKSRFVIEMVLACIYKILFFLFIKESYINNCYKFKELGISRKWGKRSIRTWDKQSWTVLIVAKCKVAGSSPLFYFLYAT